MPCGTVGAELTHGLPLDHDVTINLAITGDVTDADYDLPVAQIVIPQGQLAGSTSINVFDDVRDEDMEQLRVVMVSTIGASQGAVREHVVEIQDDDEKPAVFFTTPSQSITEDAGVVTLTATLSRTSGRDVIVPVAFSGSATPGADYVVPAPASILIPAGEISGTFDLTITDDNAIEPAEMIVVSMLPSQQAELSSAVGQPIVVSAIIAPSDAPDVSLDSAYRITTEDTSTFFITARLSRFSDELITVPIALSGTAQNGVDYRIVTALLEFFPGSAEASIQINIVDDTIAEGVETIVVELLSAVNANLGTTQLTVTEILDNDVVRVSFEPGDVSQFEGHTVSVNVLLSKPSSTGVVIPFFLSGSATRNSDYTISSPELSVIPFINHRSLVLAPGANGLTAREATIQVSLVDNNINEFTETLYLTLGNTITGGFLGDVVTKKITIKDNDPLVSMILPSNSKYVEDNVSIAFGVELSAPTDEAITVPIRYSGTAKRGSDFNAPNSVTIPKGATSTTFNVSIVEDAVAESTENALIALGSPSAGILASPTKSNLLIEDDEVFVNWASRYRSSDEADGAQTFTIFLARPTTEDVTVNLAYASEGRTVTYTETFFKGTFFETTTKGSYITGKADLGSDYKAEVTSVVIPAGQTSVSFQVPVIDDQVKENAEIIKIIMKSASNALLPVEASQRQLTFTITDQDVLTKSEVVELQKKMSQYTAKELLGFDAEKALSNAAKDVSDFSGNETNQEDMLGIVLYAAERAAAILPIPGGMLAQAAIHAVKWTQEEYPLGLGLDTEKLQYDMDFFTSRYIDDSGQRRGDGAYFEYLAVEMAKWITTDLLAGFIGGLFDGPAMDAILQEIGLGAVEVMGDYYRENEEKVNRYADEKIGQPVTEWVKANDDGYVAAKENVGSYVADRNPLSSGGYIANGTIYFDANFNGVLDELELSGTTTGDGHALITNIASADKNNDGQLGIDEGQWVSVAGIDTSIDQEIKIPFVAPASFSAITPTSTLIAAMMNSDAFERTEAGVHAAEQRFFESIGLPEFELADLDILHEAAGGDVLSAALFAKETQYYNTVIAVASMFDALETGLPFEHLSSLVFDDLADKISSPGGSLNLTNSLMVKSVIQGVSIRSGIVIDAGVAAAVADVLARSSRIIDQETPEGSEAFLDGVVKAHKFVQSDLVVEIADLVRGDITIATFNSNNSDLESRIQSAQTFDILPVYLVVEDATMTEGSDGASSVLTFTVTPLGTSVHPVSVSYNTEDRTAVAGEDYLSVEGTLTWAPGDETPRTISVNLTADNDFEPNEAFALRLTDPQNATPLIYEVNGHIENDDMFVFTSAADVSDQLVVSVNNSGLILENNGEILFDTHADQGVQIDIGGQLADSVLIHDSSGSDTEIFTDQFGVRTLRIGNHVVHLDGSITLDQDVFAGISGIPNLIFAETPLSLSALVPAQLNADTLVFGWKVFNQGEGVLAVVGASATLNFVPQESHTLVELTVSDGLNSVAIKQQIHVFPPNVPPVAVDDTASTNENSAIATDVIANDSDLNVEDVLSLVPGSTTLVSMTLVSNGVAIPVNTASLSESGNSITFDPGTDFDFLATGETATIVIDYTVTDDNVAPLSDQGTLTITITGVNDAPDITVAVGDSVAETLTEIDAGLSVSDTLSVEDLDTTDTVVASVFSVVVTGDDDGLGNAALLVMMSVGVNPVIDGVSKTGTISWAFDSVSEAFDHLAVGESLVLAYTLRATDSQGATNDQTVTITINGTNDPPRVNAAVGSVVIDEGQIAANTGTFHDIDSTNIVMISASIGTIIQDSGNAGNWSWQFPGIDDLATTVTITANDGNGGTDTTAFNLTVNNVDPVIDTLAATSVDENGVVHLTGTYHDAGTLDTHELTINWGEGDPQAVAVSGGSFDITHQYLDDNPTDSPSDIYTITATVTDDDGGSASSSRTLTVNNVAPVITAVSTSSPITDKAVEGEVVSVSGAFTDVGTLDTHTAVVDWGDGTSVETITVSQGSGSGTFTGNHAYANGGIFTITVTLTDDDTGSNTAITTAFITGVGINDGVLQIVGTSGDDLVTVNKQGNGILRVHASFIDEPSGRMFNLSDIDRIVAVLCEGDDQMTIAGNITLNSLVDAGGGDDHINGGGGSDVILGRDGDDHLNGGPGFDILIGGSGFDRIVSGPDEDLLFGGIFSASFDGGGAPLESFVDDQPALLDIQNIWNDATRSIEDRKADVEGFDDFFSRLVDDEDTDSLTGGSDRDWFLLFAGDVANDLKTKKGDLLSSLL